jgi:hypothetical protein
MKTFVLGIASFVTALAFPLMLVTGYGLWLEVTPLLLGLFVPSFLIVITSFYALWRYPAYREYLLAWMLPF